MPRIDFPGAFHHVYARGIEKREIFADEDDRKELRRRIRLNLTRFNAVCLAWAFMPNHFHLLYHSIKGNLPVFMRCLMSGYSTYFNRKHDRAGHLFQNRYKSSLIDSERYLLELIRYIHLNPIRSGLVASLEELALYPWTGSSGILRSHDVPWKDYPFLRDFFAGGNRTFDAKRYLEFLKEGLREKEKTSVTMEESYLENILPDGHHMEKEKAGASQGEFHEVVARVSQEMGTSTDRILSRRRDRITSKARRKILKICIGELGLARSLVCAWLGITHAAACYLLREKGTF